jgi:hypothetical protein
MTASRGSRLPVLLAAATLIGWLMLGPAAHAQVFKPRGKAAATGKVAARKATAPAATPAKKPTRATGPTTRKVVGTPPAKKPRRAGKARAGRDDDVKIEDDDDDVKITDD